MYYKTKITKLMPTFDVFVTLVYNIVKPTLIFNSTFQDISIRALFILNIFLFFLLRDLNTNKKTKTLKNINFLYLQGFLFSFFYIF